MLLLEPRAPNLGRFEEALDELILPDLRGTGILVLPTTGIPDLLDILKAVLIAVNI